MDIALLIALVSLIFSGGMFFIERARDKRADAERVTARAAGMNAWTAVAEPNEGEEGKSRYGVQVRNSTEVPVYDVVIVHAMANGKIFGRDLRLDTVPPGDFFFESSFREGSPTWDFGSMSTEIERLHPVMRKRAWSVISLTFRDSAGQWWLRTQNGLTRCGNPQDANNRADIVRQEAAARAATAAVRVDARRETTAAHG